MAGSVQFSAARAVAVGLLGLAAVFGAFAYAESTTAGRLLLGVATLGCAIEGVRCALIRPVLSADDDGILVVPGVRPVRIAWTDVESIDGRVDRRRGTTARTLQVDVGETLYAVPAYRLGAPIAEVVSALEAARPR